MNKTMLRSSVSPNLQNLQELSVAGIARESTLPKIKRTLDGSFYLTSSYLNAAGGMTSKASKERSKLGLLGDERGVRLRRSPVAEAHARVHLSQTLDRSPTRVFNMGLKSIKHRDRIFPSMGFSN